jgi:hypothetical protein
MAQTGSTALPETRTEYFNDLIDALPYSRPDARFDPHATQLIEDMQRLRTKVIAQYSAMEI